MHEGRWRSEACAMQESIGARTTASERLAEGPARGLAMLLDRPDAPGPGELLPPLWHWLYFQPCTRQSQLAADGHPLHGLFAPPAALPRRMWAGSRLEWLAPLRIGDFVTRASTLVAAVPKKGRSGALLLVTLRHEYFANGNPALVEEQDLVYREAAPPGPLAPPAPIGSPALAARQPRADESGHWSVRATPDERLLFRYSALTGNAHRIHYDLAYAQAVEGYLGLVVQGPLLATLLLETCAGRVGNLFVRRFEFRAVKAALVRADGDSALALCGRMPEGGCAQLWVTDAHFETLMTASAQFCSSQP